MFGCMDDIINYTPICIAAQSNECRTFPPPRKLPTRTFHLPIFGHCGLFPSPTVLQRFHSDDGSANTRTGCIFTRRKFSTDDIIKLNSDLYRCAEQQALISLTFNATATHKHLYAYIYTTHLQTDAHAIAEYVSLFKCQNNNDKTLGTVQRRS